MTATRRYALALVAAAALAAAPTAALARLRADVPGVTREDGVVCGRGGEHDLALDIYRPGGRARQPRPGVLVIHGGGWAHGARGDVRGVATYLAERGFVAAAVEYRLAPTDRFPAQVEDVKCAVRWLRANAGRYGVDPERIGAVGFSAGGHLALMLATTTAEDGLEGAGGNPDQSSRIQACVSFFGPTDLRLPRAKGANDRARGIVAAFVGDAPLERASPICFASPDDPPTLLLHGQADPLVPVEQSYAMRDALAAEGVPVRVVAYPGEGHGFRARHQDSLREMAEFLRLHLKGV